MAGEPEIVRGVSPLLTGGETAPPSPQPWFDKLTTASPVEGEGEEGDAGIQSAAEAHTGLAQLTGPDLRGVGPGAQTRWQGVVVSVEPGKTPQEILVAAERELIEAYLRGSRYLLLLPKQSLLSFAEDQPNAARLMREISAAHPDSQLLMLQLDIRYHRHDRTNAEATFRILPPESETYPDPKPIVLFELPHIASELRQAIRLVGFEVEDLFLLLSGIPPGERKVTLSRLGAFFDVRVGLPSSWKEKGYLTDLALRVPPSDRAIFFVALRSVAFMHGLRVLARDLKRRTDGDVLERTTAVLRQRASWLLSEEVRAKQGEKEWSRRIRVALTPGLGREFSDRLYGEELRTRLLTAFLNWLAKDRHKEVSMPAAVDIVSSLMLQDPFPRTAEVIERTWNEPGWEGLEAFVRETCREITRRNWMEFPFDQALAEVPALRQQKRWRRISDPLLPKAFLPDEIEALVEGVPASEQGPLADHVAALVEGDLLNHIESQPTVARAELVRWISEISPEQRLQAVRYLRTLVAGNFSDEAVRAMRQNQSNGRTKALKGAVHLQATWLMAQVTDEGAQWYDDAGVAARRMTLFCPNSESSEKLFEAVLRSFGYEDLREEVPSVTRELLQALLSDGQPQHQVLKILSRVYARTDLHTVYSVACSFFSGLEDLPEAVAKLRLLETSWDEVRKKGNGGGSGPTGRRPGGGGEGHANGSGPVATTVSVKVVRSAGPEDARPSAVVALLIEALSQAHVKGLKKTARVLRGMVELAVAGKLEPSNLSPATLNRLLKRKGLGYLTSRLGTTDRLILLAATSARNNDREIQLYLESRALTPIGTAGLPPTPTITNIPSFPVLRTIPLH